MSRLTAGILVALLLMAMWSAPVAAAAAAQDSTTAPPTQTVPIKVVNTKEPVVIPVSPVPPLANTGSNILSLLEIGIALIGAGIFVMGISRWGMVSR